jgi:hypothetical protein
MDRKAEIHQLRAGIEALAGRFADALSGPLRAALERNLEHLIVVSGARVARLDDATLRALRQRTDEAIARSVDDVTERVRSVDLWTSPTVTFAGMEPTEPGWDDTVPHWLARWLGRMGRASNRMEPRLGALEEPTNRIWITILNAADPLDPILTEYGFEPSSVPNPGGARFGLQPTTLLALDSSEELAGLWRKYGVLYKRFRWLTREGFDVELSRKAVKRWRDAGPDLKG